MKIVTASSGNKTLKMSKIEWIAIGKQAGWAVAESAKDDEDEKDDKKKKKPGVPDGTGPGKDSKECPFNKDDDEDDKEG